MKKIRTLLAATVIAGVATVGTGATVSVDLAADEPVRDHSPRPGFLPEVGAPAAPARRPPDPGRAEDR